VEKVNAFGCRFSFAMLEKIEVTPHGKLSVSFPGGVRVSALFRAATI